MQCVLGKITRKGGPFKTIEMKKKGYGVNLRKPERILFLVKITLNSPVTPQIESIKKKIALVYFRFNTVYYRRILSVTIFDDIKFRYKSISTCILNLFMEKATAKNPTRDIPINDYHA